MVLALTLFLCSCGGGGAAAPSPSPMVGNPGTTALMLAASPAALSLPAGASTTFNLGVSPVSYSPVAVTLVNALAGVRVTTNAGAAAGSGQQTETLSVAASVVPNTYAMTLMGTSGSVTDTTSFTL